MKYVLSYGSNRAPSHTRGDRTDDNAGEPDYVQDEIQATNRSRVPASHAAPENSKADHIVRWNAIDSSQAIAI
jgi:hypothetical protein